MPSFFLIFNAGSSSLKFALYENARPLKQVAGGSISGVGRERTRAVWEKIAPLTGPRGPAAVGHRIVHGGAKYSAPIRLDAKVIRDLHRLSATDPNHLPAALALIAEVRRKFPQTMQVACFDTHFHRTMPRAAYLFPLPRRYEKKGLRRYGFHGLSYEFLMEEIARLGKRAAQGRIILAHFGSGASLAAVRQGKCLDTSMGFTPAAGVPMGTRSGDLDPGLFSHLAITEGMSAAAFQKMVNEKSGLLGLSGLSADMRTLLKAEAKNPRAADAVALFCYQARKWLGAYSAALGGLDTLVFAGGMGENSPAIRARVCAGLEFLGVRLARRANARNAPLISSRASRVAVRVIRTDEQLMIARSVARMARQRPA